MLNFGRKFDSHLESEKINYRWLDSLRGKLIVTIFFPENEVYSFCSALIPLATEIFLSIFSFILNSNFESTLVK